ncbi:outer membrane protein assembly factor BamE (lipoprotein component of BamABCDE complex) [Erwinia toletana]|uniref:Outer membrane protein assembly factor BamE (Lipoprotein component of BamABCDE complex) n=1 Tax=Winslowiella toletana TaxID=92490 RepID=A0ABS4PBE1_9GAMM|nr:hypothetical protein [Winslowiella toletana]MBP2169973.1 outer membrane protein assembly factor BamE (lipoprotein component of BamABCDE complex) [Winslowiella toletana]
MKSLLPVLMILLLLTGCVSSVGQDFDDAKLSQIRKGQSTKSDLIALFGQPATDTPYPEGNTILVWNWSQARAMNTTSGKTLTIKLDNGRVESYSVSKTSME